MLKLAKFVFGVFSLGVLVLIGASLMNPAAGRQADAHGAEAMLQTVAIQANSLLRDTSLQIPANMRGFTTTASAFIDSNVTTAALQFKAMRSSIAASVSALSWMRPDSTTVAQAAQDANIGAHTLARKMPTVNALRSNMDHLSSLHPTLSSANVGF
jgi:hypothetical protein